jgi:hypothetical protein
MAWAECGPSSTPDQRKKSTPISEFDRVGSPPPELDDDEWFNRISSALTFDIDEEPTGWLRAMLDDQ